MTTDQTTSGTGPTIESIPPGRLAVVRVFVDTAMVLGDGGGKISRGLYMFDNRSNKGSSGQGSMNVTTCVNVEDYIAFYIDPIDAGLGDTLEILGFQFSKGDPCGSEGYPRKITTENGSYWLGKIMHAVSATYQISFQLKTTGMDGSSEVIEGEWDPYITVLN